jgi:hypothetical protein
MLPRVKYLEVATMLAAQKEVRLHSSRARSLPISVLGG